MSRNEARPVAERLRDAGYQVVFAGGAVRDRLLGRCEGDVDIATSATPGQVMALFEKTIPVGESFGVIKVVHRGEVYDVATFRTDVGGADGRHPESVQAATLEDDVLRRDFTINGLVEDPFTGEVFDWVGGQADLAAGVVRAIGDPAERFEEDSLRLLRGVRFASCLGFELEPETASAMRAGAEGLRRIALERVREELFKMLASGGRRRAVELLDETALLPLVLPEISAMHGVEQPPEYHPEGDVWIHTLLALEGLGPEPVSPELALGTLLHDVGKPPTFRVGEDRIRFDGHVDLGAEMADAICERLRLSRDSRRHVVALVKDHLQFMNVPNMRSSTLRRFMAQDHFEDLMLLYRADCGASHGQLSALPTIDAMRAQLAEEALVPPPLVQGSDILAMGVAPGPRVGELLRAVEDRQLEGDLVDREAALIWLRESLTEERGPGS
jgi:putative nucleotidyltransferase with HDIG domain